MRSGYALVSSVARRSGWTFQGRTKSVEEKKKRTSIVLSSSACHVNARKSTLNIPRSRDDGLLCASRRGRFAARFFPLGANISTQNANLDRNLFAVRRLY